MMNPGLPLLPLLLLLLLRAPPPIRGLAGSGDPPPPPPPDEDAGASHSRPLYKDAPWCAPLRVKDGDVRCRGPHARALGSSCDVRCRRGFELRGPATVVCRPDRRWSDRAACAHVDAPRIRCPSARERVAEPNKLTARVTWETPEGRDTADGVLTDVILLSGLPPGSDFPEGDHRVEYAVHDGAGNRGSCRFRVKVRVRRCGKLHAPDHGYVRCSGDGDNYGATCEFSCGGGYELQGSPARVCQSSLAWSGTEPSCAAMSVNVGVGSAAALLDQFYEKRRLLVVSAPSARSLRYRLQLEMLQQAQCGLDLRHVTVVELVGVFPTLVGRVGAKILPPALALQLRLLLRIPPHSFGAVLLDKQGNDRERYVTPATPAALFHVIDAFALRREEAARQAEMGQACGA
ncbi:hypothetical protein ACRRTK_002856 [Alexandromys fortis]